MDDFARFLDRQEPEQVTFLCGAGISYDPPSSLPTVRTFLRVLAQVTGQNSELTERICEAANRAIPPPRFEVLLEELAALVDGGLDLAALFATSHPNPLHQFLGWRRQIGNAIVTTNFDTCIEQATSGFLPRYVFDGSDLHQLGSLRGSLAKPHGSIPQAGDRAGQLVATIGAMARTANGFSAFPQWQSCLLQLLNDKTVIVVGYSGSDDFDITPLMLRSQPRHLIWIDHDGASLAPEQASLTQASPQVRAICEALRGTYLRGTIRNLFPANQIEHTPTTLDASEQPGSAEDRVKQWAVKVFNTPDLAHAALNAVLLHVTLYDDLLKRPMPNASADLHLQRCRAMFYLGRYDAACGEAQDALRGAASLRRRAAAEYLQSASLTYLGKLKAASEAASRHLGLADELGDHLEAQTALQQLGAIATMQQKYDAAARHYEAIRSLQVKAPSLQSATYATWGLADVALLQGNIAKAIDLYQAARETSKRLGSRNGVAWLDANLGEAWRYAREHDKARNHLKSAGRTFGETQVASGSLLVKIYTAKLDYSTGNKLEALSQLETAVKLIEDGVATSAWADALLLSYILFDELGELSLLVRMQAAAVPYAQGARPDTANGMQNGAVQVACDIVASSPKRRPDLYARCRSALGLE